MNYSFNRTWVEINLDNIIHNVNEIKRITNHKPEIMGVVKANGYGHGAVHIANTLIHNGVNRLAVATIEEALQLRRKFNTPILLLNQVNPLNIDELIQNNITPTVYSNEYAKVLSENSLKFKTRTKIHLKIDTGMSRVGFKYHSPTVKNILEIANLPNIDIEGLFTHFACADTKDSTYTYSQFNKFMELVDDLKKAGLEIPFKHVANSAATIQYPKMHLDIVRPGIALYGLYPSNDIDRNAIHLKEAMSLKTSIALVKSVEPNTAVSYGGIFKTKRTSTLATLPIGYADGYSRLLTSKGNVLVKGKSASIVGKICMDQCVVDVTDINEDINTGDEVVLFGEQNSNRISIDEVASKLGSINYEIVCMAGNRLTRIYYKDGDIVHSQNYLD